MPSSLIESPWVIDDLNKQIEIEIAIWECKRKLEQDLSLSVCVITSIVQARSVLLQSVCAASQIMDPTRYSLCKLRTVIEVVCVCGCAHCVMSNWGINSPPQTVDAFLLCGIMMSYSVSKLWCQNRKSSRVFHRRYLDAIYPTLWSWWAIDL